jgi:ATP-dependent Clp protease ATP-binding subunit ClpA
MRPRVTNEMLQHWAIMERCTVEARRVVWHARNAVQDLGGSAITLEHFVIGLMAPDVKASVHFTSLPEGGQELRRQLIAGLADISVPTTELVAMSPAVMQVMDAARAEADQQGQIRIQSHHLLVATLVATNAPVAGLLHAHGLSAERIRATISATGEPDDR